MTFLFAFKNINNQKRRFAFIIFAVAVCFTLISLQTAVTDGMMITLRQKAALYFSGHISISGFIDGSAGMVNSDELIASLAGLDRNIIQVSRRTVYTRTDANLFFSGHSIRQRRLIGVDFDSEKAQFDYMQLTPSSDYDALVDKGGILISDTAAKLLKADVGDEINIFLTTDSGQYSTGVFIIRGIFVESSLFAYVAYIPIQDMNSMLGRDQSWNTDLAVFSKATANFFDLADLIRDKLSRSFNVLPRLDDRRDLLSALARTDADKTLAVMPLEAQLAQINQLVQAVSIVSYSLLAMLILITVIGLINTYKIIIFQRTREIGVLRAIGVKRGFVLASLLWESFILATIASSFGLLGSVVLQVVVAAIDFTQWPLIGFFTEKGRLVPYLDGFRVVLNYVLVATALVVAAVGPASRASRISPVEAMR